MSSRSKPLREASAAKILEAGTQLGVDAPAVDTSASSQTNEHLRFAQVPGGACREEVDLAVQRQEGRVSAVCEAKAIAGVSLPQFRQIVNGKLRAELKALCMQLRRDAIGKEEKNEIENGPELLLHFANPRETLTQRDDLNFDAFDGLGDGS